MLPPSSVIKTAVFSPKTYIHYYFQFYNTTWCPPKKHLVSCSRRSWPSSWWRELGQARWETEINTEENTERERQNGRRETQHRGTNGTQAKEQKVKEKVEHYTRNRWRVVEEWLNGSRRSERRRTMELLTIKWALEQADIWNNRETSRVTGQAGERWSEGVRWFIGPELPIALQQRDWILFHTIRGSQ